MSHLCFHTLDTKSRQSSKVNAQLQRDLAAAVREGLDEIVSRSRVPAYRGGRREVHIGRSLPAWMIPGIRHLAGKLEAAAIPWQFELLDDRQIPGIDTGTLNDRGRGVPK